MTAYKNLSLHDEAISAATFEDSGPLGNIPPVNSPATKMGLHFSPLSNPLLEKLPVI